MSVSPEPGVIEGLDAWQRLPVDQQPAWPDEVAVRRARERLAGLPPLVFAGEADELKARLAAAGRGEAFLLQGGDCAELFEEATAYRIRQKIMTVLQMALILTYGASLPVIKMGRMAGQYAKPRSSDTETRDGVTLPAFRGDIVNGWEFTPESRTPDPARLLEAYHTSASTLNLIRAFTTGGFASLMRAHEWNRGFMANNPAYSRYDQVATEIEASRMLVWRAAWMGRNGIPLTGGQGSMSKLKAGDVAMWATTTLMDLVGPFAQTTDCPLEKFFRDAKIYQLFEGTAQVQRLVISRMQRTEYQQRREATPGTAASENGTKLGDTVREAAATLPTG